MNELIPRLGGVSFFQRLFDFGIAATPAALV
jgi:hypothetical protein